MECERIRDAMLDVLYDEADAAARQRVETHLAQCGTCREELAGLRAVRRDLAAWRLPEAGRTPHAVAPPPGWWRVAAAAVLLLAAGGALGLAGFEVEYTRGPVRVHLGRGEPAELQRLLREQEARHQAELARLEAAVQRASIAQTTAQTTAPLDEERLMQRMAAMVEQSEARQRARLDSSWNEFTAESEDRRRYDLARISAGLSYLDQKTGAQAARTSELMGYLLQASDRR